ncbi:MAG TPA: serine/threonine protein kinase, partial [Polyangiaceae bacterium]|nr:serine/threonine protein kinase [Polyangiaceae bacterium]
MKFTVQWRSIALLGLALTASACGNAFQAGTPPGFVELPDQEEYDYRATNADGLVLAVRELEHEPKGELSFWTKAIEKQLRERAGYALLGTRDVKAKTGEPGKQLRFGHDQGRTPYLYYVTLFATDDKLFVIEAGGTKALMERHAAQIDWTVAN